MLNFYSYEYMYKIDLVKQVRVNVYSTIIHNTGTTQLKHNILRKEIQRFHYFSWMIRNQVKTLSLSH